MSAERLPVQFDFFKTSEESELDAIKKQLEAVTESCHKVRKKLFSENGKLTKQILDLTERLEIIERNICRGDK